MVDNSAEVSAASRDTNVEHNSRSAKVGPGPVPVTSVDVIDLDENYLPDPPLNKDNNRDIEEVDMPVLDTDDIINVDESFQLQMGFSFPLLRANNYVRIY